VFSGALGQVPPREWAWRLVRSYLFREYVTEQRPRDRRIDARGAIRTSATRSTASAVPRWAYNRIMGVTHTPSHDASTRLAI
jgi:hypothetical protein